MAILPDMNTGPLIAEIAALVGEPARATMLSALLDGRALTARELAFAAKLPSGQAVRARAEQKLATPRNFWRSNADVRERHVGDTVQALRDSGVPEWLLRARLALAVLHVTLTRGRAHPETLDDLARLHEALGDFPRA